MSPRWPWRIRMRGSSGPCWPMMMCTDQLRRTETGYGALRRTPHRIREGVTPRSATRIIRDDTTGTPGTFRPWTICRPTQGRCAHEENARNFHQGPDISSGVQREAGYIDAALFLLLDYVRRRCCLEGWVHISHCAQAHLTPAHSSQLQPTM